MDSTLTPNNAEGLQASTSGSSQTYYYDGDGRRVKKTNGRTYWYSILTGELLVETDQSGNPLNQYIYFAGRRVARKNGSGAVYYYFEEPAGRTRTVTSATGVPCNEADYYLFGGEQSHGNFCDQNYHFAGMYRDGETGNDATWFRMYESNLGRWMSPDPLAGDILNPQSLNRYAYVMNNPCNLVDPLGLQGCTFEIAVANLTLNDAQNSAVLTGFKGAVERAGVGVHFVTGGQPADCSLSLTKAGKGTPPLMVGFTPPGSGGLYSSNTGYVYTDNVSMLAFAFGVGSRFAEFVAQVAVHEFAHYGLQMPDPLLANPNYDRAAAGVMNIFDTMDRLVGTPHDFTPIQAARLQGQCSEAQRRRRGGGGGGGVGGPYPSGGQIFGYVWTFTTLPHPSGYHSGGNTNSATSSTITGWSFCPETGPCI